MAGPYPAERLAQVGFGGGTIIAAGYGHVDEDDAHGAVEAAYTAGVRFFDTAHFYGSGRSEAIIGSVLAEGGRRDRVRLCTKGGVRYRDPTDLRTLEHDCSYDGLRAFLEESLTRLRTDHVDAYLLHQFDPAMTPEAQMEALGRLRDEGLTREVGFCNFGSEARRRALATGIPSVVEYSFSLLDRRYAADLAAMGERGGTRITFGTYVHGLLSEGFAPDHEFDATDWRGRSVREGSSGTSGNVFFAGGAFARNVEVARRLQALADRQGTSLAAFVLALTLREPESDIALMGCRTAAEVVDGLEGLRVELDDATRDEVAAVLAGAERPSENLLGAPA